MELIADALLAAGAFGAAFYCFVLQRRLTRFTRLESGMGGAIAVLSVQVDDLDRALTAARAAAEDSTRRLGDLNDRADAAAIRLELLLSSLHDLPTPGRGASVGEAAPEPTLDRRVRFVRSRVRAGAEAAE